MADKNTTSQTRQMLIDFGPLVIFFISYKFYDIYVATAVFMVAIVGGLIASKLLTGRISGMLWFTFGVVMVMGGLTLFLKDPTFVKMKPTIVYALFAAILGIAMLRGKLIVKNMLAKVLGAEAPDALWRKLTKQAVGFFLAMMVFNEVIWRNFSEDTWVNVKVFGFTGAFLVFNFWIIANLLKYMPDLEATSEEKNKGD
ncbi:MAG: septation protein IspZ [Kordiimonadaceae bacterium]|nr:septation protein IspZ [Kordiimonadaceae bacterium]